jgi:hypothetical protein
VPTVRSLALKNVKIKNFYERVLKPKIGDVTALELSPLVVVLLLSFNSLLKLKKSLRRIQLRNLKPDELVKHFEID